MQIMYLLVVWPFQEDRLNTMEFFVESKQYLVAFMIFFCQCSDALETEEETFNMIAFVGWAGFVIEISCLAVNIFVAIYESCKYYILEGKKKKYKRAWKKFKINKKLSKAERKELKLR